MGVTDTSSGESRRNENVQFNPVDNNALKELNVRLGVTATIVDVFRPERSYFGSEFGNPPSQPIHLNPFTLGRFHGALHWSHDNSVFRARSFFQVGRVQPARDNDYGFQVGSSFLDRTFLSIRGSQQKLRGSVNGNVLVPRSDERTPLATDPAVRDLVQRWLDAYPDQAPNRTDIDERALNTNAPQSVNDNNAEMRLDQRVGGRDQMIASYQFTSQLLDAFQLVAGQNPDADTKAQTARLTWNRAWSASLIAELSVGFDRISTRLTPEPNAVGPFVNAGAGIERLGPNPFIPIDEVQNRYRVAELTRWISANHAPTFGFAFNRRQINGVRTFKHRGEYTFATAFGRDSLTNVRMGTPLRYEIALGNPNLGYRAWDLQAFVGDSWKVQSGLDLTYSLRYAPSGAPFEIYDRTAIPYSCDCNSFGPRFGLAYRLPRTLGVIRAAYGLEFGQIFAVTYGQARFSPPTTVTVVVTEPDLANPLKDVKPEDLLPTGRSTVLQLDPDLVLPYSHHYNFSWEPALSSSWKLQLAYVGSRSHKLLDQWVFNRGQPVPGIPQTNSTINERRADDRYFDIRSTLNGARSYFDAARVTLIIPRKAGLSLEVSYWFSKAIDLGSDYANTASDRDAGLNRSQSEFDVHGDKKRLSNFDQPHSVLLRFTYEAPRVAFGNHWIERTLQGWLFSSIVLLKNGTPFTVDSGSDAPGFGNVDGSMGDRVNVLDPSILGRTIGNPDTSPELLNHEGFAFMQPDEQRGNIGMNTFRKGSIVNVNAALSRTFRLRADWSLLFRAESINLFNTPQFAAPGAELASENFGQITNTLNDGRTFRFRLEFNF